MLCRVIELERRADHTYGDELVETTKLALRSEAAYHQLGDDSPANGDRDSLACLGTSDVPA
jgi:hypothetical protein